MVALIKQIIKNDKNNYKFYDVVGGTGTKSDPFQITIIDKRIESFESVRGEGGKIWPSAFCTEITTHLAYEFVRHEVLNFRLYMIHQR